MPRMQSLLLSYSLFSPILVVIRAILMSTSPNNHIPLENLGLDTLTGAVAHTFADCFSGRRGVWLAVSYNHNVSCYVMVPGREARDPGRRNGYLVGFT